MRIKKYGSNTEDQLAKLGSGREAAASPTKARRNSPVRTPRSALEREIASHRPTSKLALIFVFSRREPTPFRSLQMSWHADPVRKPALFEWQR
jgi:hypothetical protein